MKFTIPGEPTGKARPRVVKRGAYATTYTPQMTANYENLVKLEFQQQCQEYFGTEQLRMVIRAYYGLAKSDSRQKREAKLHDIIRPTKKPDCDNVGKLIADACNGLAYRDDAQIVSMTIEKHYAEIPRVEVTIEEA